MTRLVALDTGSTPGCWGCSPIPNWRLNRKLARASWLRGLLAQGVRVVLPAVANYGLRHEYLLRDQRQALEKLDALHEVVEYLSLSDDSPWARRRVAGSGSGGQPQTPKPWTATA